MTNLHRHAPLRVALVGLGTVGGGVIRLLQTNADLIARRAGCPIQIVAISARDRNKDRGVDLSPYEWVDDMTTLATRDDIDVVVELIGGADGPALTLARQCLSVGKPFVTANKAMLAHHGLDLAGLAEKAGVALKYEAAVAGGIPVIKGMREGAAANEISRVYGILNGTCNYILTTMEKEGRGFDEVLKEAQELGYAEADPSFDIDGVDAAHKLTILASLAFGTELDFDAVATTGIRHVIAADIAEAAALGYRIRLVGMAENGPDGLFQRVHPMLVPLDHPLAHVDGSLNAVVAEGNFVGRLFFQGRGAGDGPTASAVVADLIDVARDEYGDALAMPIAALAQQPPADAGKRVGRTYLRFKVQDRPGVLAEIAAATRDAGVSIESMIQRGASQTDGVLVAIVTHAGEERCVRETLDRLAGSDSLLQTPMVMHIQSETVRQRLTNGLAQLEYPTARALGAIHIAYDPAWPRIEAVGGHLAIAGDDGPAPKALIRRNGLRQAKGGDGLARRGPDPGNPGRRAVRLNGKAGGNQQKDHRGGPWSCPAANATDALPLHPPCEKRTLDNVRTTSYRALQNSG